MRLISGKNIYKLPKYYEIHHIILKFKNTSYKLQCRSIDWGIPTLTRGFPTSYSFCDKEIEFYPIPDKCYYVEMYYTVMKKL
jgi:hypothetical protein